MRKLAFIFTILAYMASVGMSNEGYDISDGEGARLKVACIQGGDEHACNTLLSNAKLAEPNECYYVISDPDSYIENILGALIGNRHCTTMH